MEGKLHQLAKHPRPSRQPLPAATAVLPAPLTAATSAVARAAAALLPVVRLVVLPRLVDGN